MGRLFFLSYQSAVEAIPESCYGQAFCTGVECSSINRDVWNFDSQYSYSFPMSISFKRGGGIVQNCPIDIRNACSDTNKPETCHPCKDPAYCVGCRSVEGRPDTCNFDMAKCPKSAFQVSFDPDGRRAWCISPDGHLAVISYDMKNPTEKQCTEDAASWGWQPFCSDPSLCGRQVNLVNFLFQGNSYLYLKMEETGEWKKLTPKKLDNGPYLTAFSTSLQLILHSKANGGKYYQAAVNDACAQQYTQQVKGAAPPYARAQVPARNGSFYPVTGMTRTLLSDRKGHAITYEGDDKCYWRQDGLPVLMAGNAGTACNAGTFDEVVITTCAPYLDPKSLPKIPKVPGLTSDCVKTDFPQPYPDPDQPYPPPSPTPPPAPTPPPLTPPPTPPPTPPTGWPVCPPGSAIPCCNPTVSPKMMCPGSIPCQSCGGSAACQCPHGSSHVTDTVNL